MTACAIFPSSWAYCVPGNCGRQNPLGGEQCGCCKSDNDDLGSPAQGFGLRHCQHRAEAPRLPAHLNPCRRLSEAILRDICNTDSRVEMLVMSRRFGHQLALIAGIDHSRGYAVVVLDSDLQHPPSSSRSSWKFGRMALMLFTAFVNTAQSRTR